MTAPQLPRTSVLRDVPGLLRWVLGCSAKPKPSATHLLPQRLGIIAVQPLQPRLNGVRDLADLVDVPLRMWARHSRSAVLPQSSRRAYQTHVCVLCKAACWRMLTLADGGILRCQAMCALELQLSAANRGILPKLCCQRGALNPVGVAAAFQPKPTTNMSVPQGRKRTCISSRSCRMSAPRVTTLLRSCDCCSLPWIWRMFASCFCSAQVCAPLSPALGLARILDRHRRRSCTGPISRPGKGPLGPCCLTFIASTWLKKSGSALSADCGGATPGVAPSPYPTGGAWPPVCSTEQRMRQRNAC